MTARALVAVAGLLPDVAANVLAELDVRRCEQL